MLHMGLASPQTVAGNQEGKEVSYAVGSNLRLQHKTHQQSLLLTWIRTARAKQHEETLDATGPTLHELAVIP